MAGQSASSMPSFVARRPGTGTKTGYGHPTVGNSVGSYALPVPETTTRSHRVAGVEGEDGWPERLINAQLLRQVVEPVPGMEPALQLSVSEQPLYRNMQWFRGGLVCKAHGLLYHSTLGSRAIKKKENNGTCQSLSGSGFWVWDSGRFGVKGVPRP